MKKVLVFLLFLSAETFAQLSGDFVSAELKKDIAYIKSTTGTLQISILNEKIVRTRFVKYDQPTTDSSLTVIINKLRTPVPIQLSELEDKVELTSSFFNIQISKKPIKVSYFRNAEWLISEKEVDTSTKNIFSFEIHHKDVFKGGGARPFQGNFAGKVLPFTNTFNGFYYADNLGLAHAASIPFLLASQRYGIFFDSFKPGDITLDIGGFAPDQLNFNAKESGNWTYYIIGGENTDEIVENYTTLTGRQPLPPRWALGYIESRDGYQSLNQILNEINGLNAQDVPFDAVAIDNAWQGGLRQIGALKWQLGTPTQVSSFLSQLSDQGKKVFLRIEPNFISSLPIVQNSESRDFFAKKADSEENAFSIRFLNEYALLNIFNANARQWLSNQLKTVNTSGNVYWWSSRTEPEWKVPDSKFGNSSLLSLNNNYSLLWSDHIANQTVGKRHVQLTGSAYAGSQRFGIFLRTGSPFRYWSALGAQIPFLVNAGLSGLAYTHGDVGGYRTDFDRGEKDDELDTRWFQFAAFSPVMRSYGDRMNVSPSRLSNVFRNMTINAIRERYRLLPYIYSLAYKNSLTGRPLCLPMDYFENTAELAPLYDQYFFGEQLIVAPVLLHGMPLRTIVLPKGRWFDFYTNEPHNGNQKLFQDLTLEHIPVYAKAGAIIPLQTTQPITAEYLNYDSLTVKFFQDLSVANSSFTMYEDNGTSLRTIEEQTYNSILFTGNVEETSVKLTVERKLAGFNEKTNRILLTEIENFLSFPTSVLVDNIPVDIVFDPAAFTSTEQAFYQLEQKQLFVRAKWNLNSKLTIEARRNNAGILTGNEPDFLVKTKINAYPNPSDGRVKITAEIQKTDYYTQTVSDRSGKVISIQNLGKLSQGMSFDNEIILKKPGVYTISIKGNKTNWSSNKIIIN